MINQGLNIIMVLILVSVMLASCVCRQSTYKQQDFTCFLNKNYTLSTRSGSITIYDTIDEQVYYSVCLDQVRGGDQWFLGTTINVSDGYETHRLNIDKDGEKLLGLSIIEITDSMQVFDSIDLNSLVINGRDLIE